MHRIWGNFLNGHRGQKVFGHASMNAEFVPFKLFGFLLILIVWQSFVVIKSRGIDFALLIPRSSFRNRAKCDQPNQGLQNFYVYPTPQNSVPNQSVRSWKIGNGLTSNKVLYCLRSRIRFQSHSVLLGAKNRLFKTRLHSNIGLQLTERKVGRWKRPARSDRSTDDPALKQ